MSRKSLLCRLPFQKHISYMTVTSSLLFTWPRNIHRISERGRNRPFAWSGHMIQNHICWRASCAEGPQRDFQNKAARTSPPGPALIIYSKYSHHNQLLLTKFGKNFVRLNGWLLEFCHIEPMTRKPRNLGTRLCYFWWGKKKRRNSFKDGEIFWVNNKAIIKFAFRRIWRILHI